MRVADIALAAAFLAGCSHAGGLVPAPGTPAVRQVIGAPPQCTRQRTRKRYAQTETKLKTKAGAICIGAFHGFGGTLEYPGVERSIELTTRVSTGDIYNEPGLGSGKATLYLNLHFHQNTRFGSTVADKGGLEGSKFTPGQAYTAFGQVAVGHLVFMFTPCYAIATSGAYGGLLPNIGALFDNATITGNGYGVIEIYQGTQVSQECEGTAR